LISAKPPSFGEILWQLRYCLYHQFLNLLVSLNMGTAKSLKIETMMERIISSAKMPEVTGDSKRHPKSNRVIP